MMLCPVLLGGGEYNLILITSSLDFNSVYCFYNTFIYIDYIEQCILSTLIRSE